MAAFLPLLLLAVAANAALLVSPSLGLNQDGLYLLDAKRALTASALADWNPRDATPCGWTGVSCVDGAVTEVSLPNANLNGSFPAALCRLPRLQSLNLRENYIGPDIAAKAIAGCKALVRLDLYMNTLVGPLPDALADLPELVYLSLEANNFSGPIPESFGTFKKLQSLSLVNNLLGGKVPAFLGRVATLRELNMSYNTFAPGPVPAELGDLTALRVLWLAGCNLVGSIPASLGRLANLTDLDLSLNALTGPIPPELAGLTSAVQIELYNNSLSGPIPKGFGKLAELRSIDISMNRLGGAIPHDLFEAPKLESLHLYLNSLTGPVPESAAKASSLVELRLFSNRLNGTLPADLGKNTPLVCLNLSDNSISGEIPRGICDRGELEELLMLNNVLTGHIPEGLGRCHRLRRVRLSKNRLDGNVPGAVWGLPHMALLELNDNQLAGEISPVIAGAANLSKLVISNNRLTGSIPSEIGSVAKLYELSADGNMLSGPLPSSLGSLAELGRLVLHNNSLSGQLLRGIRSWKQLSELNLADNGFTGAIPPELGDLPMLNYLDLSGNRLTGQVPAQLENLKLDQFNVSNNQLSGQLPPQYATEAYRSSFLGNPGLCGDIAGLCSASQGSSGNHSAIIWMMRSIFIFAAVVLVAGVAWFYWRYRSFNKAKLRAERSKWTLTSFHKVSFSEHDILDCLDEDNVIGSGASGKVYKAVLGNGEVVAVKKLWGGALKKDVENAGEGSAADNSFEAEVRTLGKIRHKNIVKLLCCCTHNDSKMLVYEYMPNGSLGDVLHSSKAGLLDWPTRYKIALDAAEGLSYLHQDCVPAIVHRDVKSNNILLDAEFSACVADFGVAKVVEMAGRAPKSMSVIAGSCGYIAPEYAYTLRVNEKSDIYSFGVVLLELVTGKPPVDPEFGEKDLVKWVCGTIDQKGVEHVLDSRLDMAFKEEISRVLNIGLICASSLPINRPAMRRVVKMLQEVRADARPRLDKDGKLSPYYYDDTSDQGSSV
ncbi:receptor-like protein kinase HSL1 [Triticum dicoccoides]|uniref:receptor-like protein kinase HSL1 n=1 Tax=Triticum dicoccoides TaxID=85692 RepID=UPI0018909B4D|nr:receptor-like protein kinase HSL1 [Triticum dicoccoides]